MTHPNASMKMYDISKYSMINEYIAWNIELGSKMGGYACCHLVLNTLKTNKHIFFIELIDTINRKDVFDEDHEDIGIWLEASEF